jgi:hypothetical protein
MPADAQQPTAQNADFVQGIACALAALIRDHDQPTIAISILRGLGVTASDLRGSGVETYDLTPIMGAMRQ